jgi:hypothetical protein
MPVKDSHTRAKPLTLASGHSRHTYGRHTRARHLCPLALALGVGRHVRVQIRDRFTSETAMVMPRHLDPEVI